MNTRIPVLDQLEDQFAELIDSRREPDSATAGHCAGLIEPTSRSRTARGSHRVRFAGQRSVARRRRSWIATGALVAAATATAFAITVLPNQPAVATLTRTLDGDAHVLEFTSLNGSTDEINAQLRAYGYGFTVDFVPGPPSIVGEVSAWGSWSTGPDDPHKEPALTGEYIAGNEIEGDRYVLRISGDTSRTSDVVLVRRAFEGEDYVVSDYANAAGNPLACRNLVGPLDEVTPKLDEAGIEYEFRLVSPGQGDVYYPDDPAIEGTFVHKVLLLSGGLAVIFLEQTPMDYAAIAQLNDQLMNSGCADITE